MKTLCIQELSDYKLGPWRLGPAWASTQAGGDSTCTLAQLVCACRVERGVRVCAPNLPISGNFAPRVPTSQMSEARVRARSSLRCLDRPYRLVGVRRLVGVAVGVH